MTPSQPGTSPLHRLPALVKLAGLATAGTALFFTDAPLVLAAAAGVALGLARLTGTPAATIAREMRAPAFVLALLALANIVFVDGHTALVVTLRLSALALLAFAVTASTTTAELMAALERLLQPLGRLGLVDPERAALTIALAIRFVPLIGEEVRALREAQSLRGIRANPVALAVPLIVRVLLRAEQVADALAVRGLADSPRPDRSRKRDHT